MNAREAHERMEFVLDVSAAATIAIPGGSADTLNNHLKDLQSIAKGE